MTSHYADSNCQCVDHEVWRCHSDYCNCDSCKAIVGVYCDVCGAFNNPLPVAYFVYNGVTLCDRCHEREESRRDMVDEIVTEKAEDILRIDYGWKEQNK